jgi:hypothetical protein
MSDEGTGGLYNEETGQIDPNGGVARHCPLCRKATTHKMLASQFVCTECFPDAAAADD